MKADVLAQAGEAVRANRIRELMQECPRTVTWRDVVGARVVAHQRETAEIQALPRAQGAMEEDRRADRLRTLRQEIDILTVGPAHSWDRAQVLEPLAVAAGLKPRAGERDASAGLGGLNRTNRLIAEMRTELDALGVDVDTPAVGTEATA